MKAAASEDKKNDTEAKPAKGLSLPAPDYNIASVIQHSNNGEVAQRASVNSTVVIQMYRPRHDEIGSIFIIKDPRNKSHEVAARFLGYPNSFGGFNFEWHHQTIEVEEEDIIGPVQKSELAPAKYQYPHDAEEEDLPMGMELSSPDLSVKPQSDSYSPPIPEKVISGHGAFNENYLQSGKKRSEGKKAKFIVPDGITIVMYAPPGAALENQVANAVESGQYPGADQVMLENNSNYARLEVPQPYPYVFKSGEEIINYTVSPPNRLKIEGSPITVSKPQSLLDLVSGIQAPAIIHYACCSSAYPNSERFRGLFDYRGYNVCFKK
jgi:hypothetical protein